MYYILYIFANLSVDLYQNFAVGVCLGPQSLLKKKILSDNWISTDKNDVLSYTDQRENNVLLALFNMSESYQHMNCTERLRSCVPRVISPYLTMPTPVCTNEDGNMYTHFILQIYKALCTPDHDLYYKFQ